MRNRTDANAGLRVVVIGASAFCVVIAAGARLVELDQLTQILQRLRSPDGGSREEARTRLREMRTTTIDSLLRLAQFDAQARDITREKTRAIRLLGYYRATEAVPFLVENVTIAGRGIVLNERHPLNQFPAAMSLVDIAGPAIDAITAKLSRSASEDQLRLFAWVIYLIDGKEVGLYRLQHALAETPAGLERKRENLTRLIEIYQTPDFDHVKNWPRPDR